MADYYWNVSAKGNSYTKVGNYLCVVGQSKYGWWALVEDQFLEGKFKNEDEAKAASVKEAKVMVELDEVLGVLSVD